MDSSTCNVGSDGSTSTSNSNINDHDDHSANVFFCTTDVNDNVPESPSSSSSSSSLSDLLTLAMAAVSTASLTTILLMQLDGISRRVLSPERLLAKRRQEYKYVIEQCCEYNSLLIRQHIGGGKGVYDPKTEKNAWEKLSAHDIEEMKTIIYEDILQLSNDKKKKTVISSSSSSSSTTTTPCPVIVALEQDLMDENDPNTYYLYLAFPSPTQCSQELTATTTTATSSTMTSTLSRRKYIRKVRVPLVAFCELLATAFEERILTSTTLCFVADASCGMGTNILSSIAQRCNYGVATIIDPSWMTSLSILISKTASTSRNSTNLSTIQFERILFALCRLDAWRICNLIENKSCRTILFTLPGQACVPVLLPLIQKVFVHERHVYVYDGCCYSVEWGIALRKKYGSSYRQPPTLKPMSIMNKEKEEGEYWEEISCSPEVISGTYPMSPMYRPTRELVESLSKINGVQASIVEAWIASVDTFLDMKSKEKKNYYTPFVCRMGFLMKRSGIGNGDGTKNELCELALKNVLQYITGSKSRALPNEVMTEAMTCLNELRTQYEDMVRGGNGMEVALSSNDKLLIEKCVFAHKSILIGEKTLLDTVQPKNDWSLKATKKLKSCACCIGGDEDEDEDTDNEKTNEEGRYRLDESADKDSTKNTIRSKYIDGKNQFAFDPTMFSK